MKKSNAKEKICGLVSYAVLAVLTVAACWFFAGRYGVFGANMDWISQHSVFPEYFRQQFYQTGQFFPEYAANIGGGQNIYNFSYYGLYNPIVLIAYLLLLLFQFHKGAIRTGKILLTAQENPISIP